MVKHGGQGRGVSRGPESDSPTEPASGPLALPPEMRHREGGTAERQLRPPRQRGQRTDKKHEA